MRALIMVMAMPLALSSCALVARHEIDHDHQQVKSIQNQLKCGMTTKDTEDLVGRSLLPMPAADPEATHVYRMGFVSLWLIYENDRLRSSQVMIRDGLKAMRAGAKKEHCS